MSTISASSIFPPFPADFSLDRSIVAADRLHLHSCASGFLIRLRLKERTADSVTVTRHGAPISSNFRSDHFNSKQHGRARLTQFTALLSPTPTRDLAKKCHLFTASFFSFLPSFFLASIPSLFSKSTCLERASGRATEGRTDERTTGWIDRCAPMALSQSD